MLKASIIGNLGSDPEMQYSASGSPYLRFRVASNFRARSAEGEWQDRTEWVRVTVFGQRAESLSQYLKKGSRVFVDGRLEARPWLNNQQQPQSGLEIIATDVEFMSSRTDDEARGGGMGGNDFGGGDMGNSAPPRQRPAAGSPSPAPRQATQSRPEPSDDGDLEDLPF